MMKALRYYGAEDIRLDNIPEPSPKEGEVKIKVRRLQICGSDMHSWHAPLPGVSPTATQPHPVTNDKLPVIMGHEFSGTIVDVGPGVDTSRLSLGGHVVVEALLSCMKPTCYPCSTGLRNICPLVTFIGIGGCGGGLAEYICVNQKLVYALPPNVPLDVGALMEPLAVAWHAVKRSNFKAGDSVFILGAGPVGLLTLRVVKALGASWVGISEPVPMRRELALKHGASAAFDPTSTTTDIVTEAKNATDGRGADVVFDCAGIQRTLDAAFLMVKPRGTIVNVAIWITRPELDMVSLLTKEVILTSTLSYDDQDYPDLLEAVAQGKFDGLEDIITRRIGFDEFIEKGIKAMLYEQDQQVKILVSPDCE
ncbi:alcohol dehydrogenase GroES domain protein [Cubamyces sp. BRFM 1775]|nr:alcohol dehydrogenase GroES domain protein [Cubamyces sp. BRFM 1775]